MFSLIRGRSISQVQRWTSTRSVLNLRTFLLSTRCNQELNQTKRKPPLISFDQNSQHPSSRVPEEKAVDANGDPLITVERDLPYPYAKRDENRKYFVVFAIGMTLACLVIFNYEKSSSPIINSVLYYLRRSTIGQDALGKDIDFASSWPWIWGTLNTVQGKIDIKFKVKGFERSGYLVLKAERESKRHPFEVEKFVLEVDTKDSKVEYDLMTDPEYEFDL
ncbi:hypothetical protein PVL30_004296 [Lodderomyces elongisporus]|uniref:DUF1783-domain-containing protein n=1 Tax=Lodderomyces elongisporus (strain ATCC 11503 / CBS 2605 / JCM 1781 / NBRC 1676 / NRRL YB-4239) TaxID=379508 RepID=A5E4N7_LODEL|nr:uncharacterized protein PVL30_004296 [Lodderomyces elongisporus]EDK46395.1 conserved hypothetical protein [Lodderomyces elongisporus NRRL YB-4239]WLF80513.1 hypothetical protein PVL30_004296 [Lodderomyces elongisporus]